MSQIYFLLKTNSYIQDEALYNGRMLKDLCCYSLSLALILKFLTAYGNINSIYHADEMILSFSMKIYNFLGLIQIWIGWHMDGCPSDLLLTMGLIC